MTKLIAGWSKPGNSRKWHYFTKDELRSLCGKWMFAGFREDEYDDSAENCVDCKRRVKRLRAESEVQS